MQSGGKNIFICSVIEEIKWNLPIAVIYVWYYDNEKRQHPSTRLWADMENAKASG